MATPAGAEFPERLRLIYTGLRRLLADAAPDAIAIENIFHARNVRSALQLGHARGVALLAAMESGVTVVEYTPTEIKQAVQTVFKVKVDSVRTATFTGKERRRGKFVGHRPDWKKAYVRLKPGEKMPEYAQNL